jgi:hypothetical protein
MARILADLSQNQDTRYRNWSAENVQVDTLSHRELSEARSAQDMLDYIKAEEDHHVAINATVRAKWGNLSMPEPKSIHSPAPPAKIKFEPPAQRLPSQSTDADYVGHVRMPKKRHPFIQLDPHLKRFYGR